MMISSSLFGINNKYSDTESIRMLAENGFDAYDMPFFAMADNPEHPLNTEDYISYIYDLKETAKKSGIVCNQAHAPFHSSNGDPEFDEYRFRQIVRSMECAAVLGAKTIVVHPKQHLYYGNHKNELAEINIAFYQSLIPYCEKYGIKVAVENMYQTENGLDDGRIVPSTCANPKEFCEYVDVVRSEWIVACLDIGHSVLTGNKLDDTVLALGNRLQALHVHDVDDVHDNHALPYMCNIDFQKLIDSLKKIHYQGDMTFEPCGYFWELPRKLVPSGICLMRDIGRYLVSQIVD